MTIKEMNRYMRLVNRLMWIMDHSGVSWQPEYAEEAEQIRKELKELRPVIEKQKREVITNAQTKNEKIPDPERHLPADRRDGVSGADWDRRRL